MHRVFPSELRFAEDSMQVPAFIASWFKRVVSPLFGWDPRPLALRDTLPDQSRPSVPERLVRPADVGVAVVGARRPGATNYAK
jgi:hypothetical protein